LIFALLYVVVLCKQNSQANNQPARLAFTNFLAKYNKQYSSAEEFQRRFAIFEENYNYIALHNSGKTNTFKLGMNQFGDLSNAEYRSLYLGYKQSQHQKAHSIPFKGGNRSCPVGDSSAPYNTTCDWRQANVVTPIKNQGQCGSCWSFSTTGSVEGAHALATENLVSLSEQNLMDCSKKEGNEGCDGGLMDQAFEYIIKNKGIDTEASYPYQGVDGKCNYNASNCGATISSYSDIPSKNESALASAVQTVGPVSVAIDAAGISFQFYRSGVYYDIFCSQDNLDHGVLAVGLGNDGDKDYYIVKNSWGTDWGMSGYIYMSRNHNNNCGISTQASYPIV